VSPKAVAVLLRRCASSRRKTRGWPESAGREIGCYLLDAHLAMLSNSRLLRGVYQRIAPDPDQCERASRIETPRIAESFAIDARTPNLAARIEDIGSIGKRLIRT